MQLELVAVYGTLRKDCGNDHWFTESEFIGQGKTYERYRLVINGLPYLLQGEGEGNNVVVDVYQVDGDKLRRIDGLEGHPHWYKREKIKIQLDKDNIVEAWIYLINDVEKYDTKEYYSDYINYWSEEWVGN